MHFAICFWGLLRSLSHCIDSIRENCLDPITNNGHTYDILIHTYNFTGDYVNLRNKERPGRLNFSEWELLNPYYIHIEDQNHLDAQLNFTQFTTLGDPWHNKLQSLRNHVRALSSLHHLATRVEYLHNANIRHYDGVIFLRPDMKYLHELPVMLIPHYTNTLFVPDFHRSCRGGQYNDRMVMGDVRSAVTYGKRFLYAYNYSLTNQLRSEDFLYDYLTMNHIHVIEIPYRFQRVRYQGNIHQRDQHILTPLQQIVTSANYDGLQPKYRTPWYVKFLYNSHVDDPYDIYCKPNRKLLPLDMYNLYFEWGNSLDNLMSMTDLNHYVRRITTI